MTCALIIRSVTFKSWICVRPVSCCLIPKLTANIISIVISYYLPPILTVTSLEVAKSIIITSIRCYISPILPNNPTTRLVSTNCNVYSICISIIHKPTYITTCVLTSRLIVRSKTSYCRNRISTAFIISTINTPCIPRTRTRIPRIIPSCIPLVFIIEISRGITPFKSPSLICLSDKIIFCSCL